MRFFDTVLYFSSWWTITCVRSVRKALHLIAFQRHLGGVRVIIEHESEIVLVRHWYAPFIWTLPGGAIDFGESPEDAAVREVHEETGLSIRCPRLLESPKEGSGERTYTFVVRSEAGVSGSLSKKINFEIMERCWFPKNMMPKKMHPSVAEVLALPR